MAQSELATEPAEEVPVGAPRRRTQVPVDAPRRRTQVPVDAPRRRTQVPVDAPRRRAADPGVASLADIVAQADHENFPVVTRLIPADAREQLLAVYAFARLVDDFGDEHPGDRLAALDWLEGELRAAVAGQPSHPITARLGEIIADTELSDEPFHDLIEANRRDQTVHRQATWDDLMDYCRLSANPVGTAVLQIAHAWTRRRGVLSDQVCSGLQVIEHLQDVGEDAAAGRIYLPTEDLERFEVVPDELTAPEASPALRALVAFELARARGLLEAGLPLVRSLRGWSRWAVAGYVAGGLAAADAIAAADYDVLARPTHPSKTQTLRHGLQIVTGRARPTSDATAALAGGSNRWGDDGLGEAPPALDLAGAYAACHTITRRQAKNFAYGIALLPGPKRRAMTVVYALARRVDDAVDAAGDAEVRLNRLDELHQQVQHTVKEGISPDPGDAVLVALADVLRRYRLPLDAIDDLFDGCRSDLAGTRIASYDELVVYCRRVAGSIGRLSLAIFGTDRPETTTPLADELGVALQLTNILRDVVEDRDQLGRIYLPGDDLARFGCAADASGPPDRLAALVTFEAERARSAFDVGLRLLPHLDRRSRACVAAMAGIYHRLLDRIERDPACVLRGRISLGPGQKLAVAARSLLGASRP